MTQIRFSLCALLLAALSSACAGDPTGSSTSALEGAGEGGPGGPGGGGPLPHRPPPIEAVEACDGAAVGDECSFEVHGHRIEDGRCLAGPVADVPLACAPPPPLEAVEACDGADAEDPCSFEIDGHSLDGKCVAGPVDDAPLACSPPLPPPGPGGPGCG